MTYRFASMLGAIVFGVACSGAHADVAAAPSEPANADPTRQVLVMLHLPPPHYRPGSAYAGTYSDPPGHGARRHEALALAQRNGLTLVSDWPMPAIGVDCYIMHLPAAANVNEVVRQLSRDPDTEWVQPVNLFHGMRQSPPTSLYALQPSARLWHLNELHTIATGRGVSIAIVDSGVDSAHPDLAGRVAVNKNFVDDGDTVAEGHGTAVTGIIGARGEGDSGVVGIAPQATLLALRACWEGADKQAVCSSFTIAKALQFAIQQQAQVINLSLSGPDDRLIARLLDAALARGATVVGAVDSHAANGGFPASHSGVLAVSDQSSAQLAPGAMLVAPGEDVPAPAPEGRWTFVTGSSFATAQIAGIVALVQQIAPTTSMRQSTAWMQFPTGSQDGPAGAVDACGTLRRAAPSLHCNAIAQPEAPGKH